METDQMTPAALHSRAWRRALFIPLCFAFLGAFAGTAEAARQVRFSPLEAGPDFDDAMAFFASYLDPSDYDTRDSIGLFRRSRKLGKTLDLFLREFVLVGKGDLDDDGVEERFYYFHDSPWCGSGGCSTFLVQKRNGAMRLLCQFDAHADYISISDWVSPGGYREIRAARNRIYWYDGRCQYGSPELEHLDPLPLPPIWKPIK